MTLRVACLQEPATDYPLGSPDPAADRRANLDALDRAAKVLAAQGVRLLVTPEMYLTGYNIGADAIAALAEPSDGASALAVAEIAKRHRMAIAYGYPQRDGGDVVYTSGQVVDPGRRP